MSEPTTSKGGEFHTIASEGDNRRKFIIISSVFILIAVVAVAGFIYKKTAYTPLPEGWGNAKKLTAQQRSEILQSLPSPTNADGTPVKPGEGTQLTQAQKDKILASLPPPKTADGKAIKSGSENSVVLTTKEKADILGSLPKPSNFPPLPLDSITLTAEQKAQLSKYMQN